MTIEITREVSQAGFKLLLKATASTVTPVEVFVYRQLLGDAIKFSCIASVAEINLYPPNDPGVGNVFFRLDDLDVQFASTTELEAFLTETLSHIEQLDTDYQAFVLEGKYNSTETVTLNEDS